MIKSHEEIDAYKPASLRSLCFNIAKAWRRRRYEAAFVIGKLVNMINNLNPWLPAGRKNVQ